MEGTVKIDISLMAKATACRVARQLRVQQSGSQLEKMSKKTGE